MSLPAFWLLFHGAVVLLIGLLAGIPYGMAINRGEPETRIAAWRLAHGSLAMGATTMIAVSAVLTHLSVGTPIRWLVVVFFAASGYGFSFALPLAAWVGHRGLSFRGPTPNRIVYIGNSVGAWSSLIGTIILLYAVLKTLALT